MLFNTADFGWPQWAILASCIICTIWVTYTQASQPGSSQVKLIILSVVWVITIVYQLVLMAGGFYK